MLLQSFNRRIICSFNVNLSTILESQSLQQQNPISIPVSNLQSSVNLIQITLKILALEWICIKTFVDCTFSLSRVLLPTPSTSYKSGSFILYIFWYLVKCSGSVGLMRNCGLKILQIDLTQYLTRQVSNSKQQLMISNILQNYCSNNAALGCSVAISPQEHFWVIWQISISRRDSEAER